MTRSRALIGMPILLLAISVALLCSCHSGSDGTDVLTAATQLRGDLDNDGNPSVSDAIAILRIVVGLDAADPAGDADGDRSTSVTDAIAVLRCVVGLAQWPLGEFQLPATRTIGPGVVVETDFTVGVQERVECLGDTTIQCDTATIAGELYTQSATVAGGDACSIIVDAQGDVTLTGELSAGSGGDGDVSGTGGDGGNGGSVTINSADGSITIGAEVATSADGPDSRLRSGSGGDGGDGSLGGDGGNGGTITLNCLNGTLTIHQSPGLFVIGDGGDGGLGVVGGDDLLTFDPPEQLPNGGGDSGGIVIFCDELLGVELHETGLEQEGQAYWAAVLDEGVGLGGDGGDGGGCYVGVDPDTGESTWPTQVSATDARAAQALSNRTIKGASGGNGATRAGNAASVAYNWSGVSVPAGSEAPELTVQGGAGGTDITFLGAVRGILVGFWTSWHVYSGNGGDARATGTSGGDGGPCQSGGKGGEASAYGGMGGMIMMGRACAEEYQHPGAGGNAYALGGRGGHAGDCCDPGRQGASGGTGGKAYAAGGFAGKALGSRLLGKAGDVWAQGGRGGNGGAGAPPGTGGSGGWALASPSEGNPASVVLLKQDGESGKRGRRCSDVEDPEDEYALMLKRSAATGTITITYGWLEAGLNTQQTTVELGGPDHPCYAVAIVTNADNSIAWIATEDDGIYRYDNPLAGGDRAPNAVLTPDGAPANSWFPGCLYYDQARDTLYSDIDAHVLAWENASQITLNRAADRRFDIGTYMTALSGDPAQDILFIARARTSGDDRYDIAAYDALSTLGDAENWDYVAPSRTIELPARDALAYDALHDLLYAWQRDPAGGDDHRVMIIEDAATANGEVEPRLVHGPDTQLGGPHGTAAGFRVFGDTDLLYVGFTDGAISVFDYASTLEGNVEPLYTELLSPTVFFVARTQ